MLPSSTARDKSFSLKNSTFQEKILGLIRQGMVLVPLWPVEEKDGQFTCSCRRANCHSDPGKHPMYAWSKPEGRARCEEEALEFWGGSHRPEVAVHLGESSLVCLDIDERHGGRDSLCQLEAVFGPLPATAIDARPGDQSYHYYFRAPVKWDLPAKVEIAPGIDLLSGNSLVCIAPSRHKSGQRRLWVNDLPIADWPGSLAWVVKLAKKPLKEGSEWILRLILEEVEAEKKILLDQERQFQQFVVPQQTPEEKELHDYYADMAKEAQKPRDDDDHPTLFQDACRSDERCPRPYGICMYSKVNNRHEFWYVRCGSCDCPACLAFSRRTKQEVAERVLTKWPTVHVFQTDDPHEWARFLARNALHGRALNQPNHWLKCVDTSHRRPVYVGFTPFPDQKSTPVTSDVAIEFAFEIVARSRAPGKRKTFLTVSKSCRWALPLRETSGDFEKVCNVHRSMKNLLAYLDRKQIERQIFYPLSATVGVKVIPEFDNFLQEEEFLSWCRNDPSPKGDGSLSPDLTLATYWEAALGRFDEYVELRWPQTG